MRTTKDKLKKIASQSTFAIKINPTKSSDWERVYIERSDGIAIGRISLHNGELYNIKSYKPHVYQDIDKTDFVFLSIEYYLKYNSPMSLLYYQTMMKIAQQTCKDDMAQKIRWRANHPSKKHQHKLEGKNIRFVLRQLVLSSGEKTK